jgi:hypothetical protein
MVSTATFAALDEVWKDDDDTGSLLPTNPYKSDDYQRKVLTGFDLGAPSKDAKRDVQKYLQQLYEDEGSEAVNRLLPPTGQTKTRSTTKRCRDREADIQRALSDTMDEEAPEDLSPPPMAPHLGPDVIFFMILAAFVSWWILSSDPADFR